MSGSVPGCPRRPRRGASPLAAALVAFLALTAPAGAADCDGAGFAGLPLPEKVRRFLACDGRTISQALPEHDLTLEAFRTGGAAGGGRAWHVAVLLGPKALAAGPLAKVPGLQALAGGMQLESLAVVLSQKTATVAPGDLEPKLRAQVEAFQDATRVDAGFDVDWGPSGTVTLPQGVHVLGALSGPALASPLGLLAEAAIPGSTSAQGPWQVRGAVGAELARAVLSKIPGLELAPPASAAGAALGLDLIVPRFTPFPFDLLQDKHALHVEVEAARLHLDLARSAAGTKVHVHADSFDKYWVLSPDRPFPVHVQGDLTLEGGAVSGHMAATYAVPPAQDPLGFLPGVHLTQLFVGGDLEHTGGKKGRDDLVVRTGAELALGDQRVRATLELEAEKTAGGKARVKDLRLELGGAGPGGEIRVDHLGPLAKVPLANELVLDQAAFGLTPRPGGVPDFYLVGGVHWTRAKLGGKVAIQKHTPKGSNREDLFVFLALDDFSLAGLMPDTEAFEGPRAVARALKLPRTLLVLNTAKGAAGGAPLELEVKDFPAPVQPMVKGFAGAADGLLPVYADSLTLLGALDFTQAEGDEIAKGFQKLGLSKFGPDGPLRIAGAIGGLTSGQLSLELAARLPGFQLPATVAGRPNPVAALVQPRGAGFFLRLVAAGDPRLEVGIEGDLRLNLPRLDDFSKMDPQDLRGQAFLRATAAGQVGLYVAGDKGGTWTDPLGFNRNLGIRDTALIVGLDVDATGEASADVGLGGTFVFDVAKPGGGRETLEYEGDLFLGVGLRPEPPYINPSKFGVNLRATELAPLNTLRIADALYTGVLRGGLANVVGQMLPPAARKGYDAARAQLGSASLVEALRVDQLPLPLLRLTAPTGEVGEGPPAVKFYFATPGTAIPGRAHMQGLGFAVAAAAELDVLGSAHRLGQFDLTMTLADGLRAMGQVPPFHLGPLQVGDPTQGSKFDLKATAAEQSFDLVAHLGLPPLLDDTTKITLGVKDSRVHVVRHLQGAFDLALDIHASAASPPVLTVDASIENGLDAVARDHLLPALGVPRVVARELVAANPVSFDEFRLKSELIGFATGKGEPIAVDLRPRYFGHLRPAIQARIPPFDWRHPERVLLGGQELPGKILASMVDAMVEANVAVSLPDLQLGGLALTGCRFGAARRGPAPGQPVFRVQGAARLLGNQANLQLDLAPREARFEETLSLGGGAVKARVQARAPIRDAKLQDLAFVAEVEGGLEEVVAREVLPALGLPAPLIAALGKMDPILIERLRFEGDLAALVTGAAPVQVELVPRYFGERGPPVRAALERLDPDDPLKSLLVAPEIVAGLVRGLVASLQSHPRDFPAVDMGWVKLDAGHLGGETVKGFDHPDQDTPVFVVRGGLSALASHPRGELRVGALRTTLSFSDDLLGGALRAAFTADGRRGAAALPVHGQVRGDLGAWLRSQGAAAVNRAFAGLDPGLAKAQADLAAARAKVGQLGGEVERLRGVVRAERARAMSPIPAAEAEVAKLQNQEADLGRQIRATQATIRTCNQVIRLCFFGKCSIHPDLIARGLCETTNIGPRTKLGTLQAALGVVRGSRLAATQSLELLRKGVSSIPIDADPRVAAVLAAKAGADAALGVAQAAVAAAQQGSQLLAGGVGVLSGAGAGAFQLDRADLYGRLPQALGGEGMVLDLEFRVAGAVYHDRLALSLTDPGLATRQLEALALGLGVRGAQQAFARAGVAAPALLGQAAGLYYRAKQATDAEVATIAAAVPGVPPKAPSSLLEAVHRGR